MSLGIRAGSKTEQVCALVAILILLASTLTLTGSRAEASASPTSSGTSSPKITTISLSSPTYRPKAPP